MTIDVEARVKRANLVTSDEQIAQLFGDDVSSRLLRDIRARQEGQMTGTRPDQAIEPTEKESKTAPTRKPRNRLGIAIAAFLTVLLVGLGWTFFTTDSVAGTPIGLAEAYLDAFDSRDAEAVRELYTTDWDIEGELAWLEAIGWQENQLGCVERAAGPPAEVHCTRTSENAWTRALGVDPIGGYKDFVIEDGQIVEIIDDNDPGTNWAFVWDTFRSWVTQNHSDDVSFLYGTGGAPMNWSPEAILMWEQYTQEFVADQAG